jgi:hypothetical protein
MQHPLEFSWVGLCRIFNALSEVNFRKKLSATLISFYSNCSVEQKIKLLELYPIVVQQLREL